MVLTAFASRENPIAARRLGCDDIVPKPIVFDLPVAVLRTVPQRGGVAAPDRAQGPALTEREPKIFTWIARGTSSSDIARIVAISDLSPSPAESPARSRKPALQAARLGASKPRPMRRLKTRAAAAWARIGLRDPLRAAHRTRIASRNSEVDRSSISLRSRRL